jgi:hypothetical protein
MIRVKSAFHNILLCSSGAECEAVQCQPGRGNALRHRTVFLYQVLHPMQKIMARKGIRQNVELRHRCAMKQRFLK